MAKILVTGGAGFIGSNVADRFIELGHRVVIVDDLSTGFKRNLNPQAKFYQIDIRSKEVEKIFKKEKPEILCHHAAQVDLRRSLVDPIADAEINILGSLNLLYLSSKYKVRKIIFASTAGVYGEQNYFPADENHPQRPVSPYGMGKLVIERYLSFYKERYGIDYVTLRYSNVFGPRQRPKGEAGVVAVFCERLLNREKAVINGDGRQTRDFVYVSDVVESNALALDYPESDIFNIATGKETDINALFRLIKKEASSSQKEIRGPAMVEEQKRSCLDISKVKKLLGWEPEYSLEEGIKKTISFYREEA
jgi:UDP-glucose 4-epimerase